MEKQIIIGIMLAYALCLIWSFGVLKIFQTSFSRELSGTARNTSMDGLRGFAAVSVFLHHSMYSFTLYTQQQKWGTPADTSKIFNQYISHLGTFSVSLFFMITAYLFWQAIILKKDKMDWNKFYIKRIFRITPLYFAIVLLVFIFFHAIYSSNTDNSAGFASFLSWLGFGFLPLKPVNGYPNSWSIVAGVFWTLAIEWKFYLFLPFLSIFAKSKRSSEIVLCILIAGVISLHKLDLMDQKELAIATCFILGAVTGHFSVFYSLAIKKITPTAASIIACAIFVYSIHEYGWMYKIKAELLAFIFFFLVVECGALKQLFSSILLRFLGTISYSIYLCHGLILTILNGFIFKGQHGYIAPTLTASLIIVLLSTFLYLNIERPFIAIGNGKVPFKLKKQVPY